MASANITSGRVDPVITQLVLQAAGNSGLRIAAKLPCNFSLRDQSSFKGNVRSLPLAAVYGDGRYVANDIKRAVGDGYKNLTKIRALVETAYECEERAGREDIDQIEIDRTKNEEVSGLEMRKTRAIDLTSTILDAWEYDCTANVFNTSNHQNVAVGSLTGGAQVAWDTINSSPMQDGLAVQSLIKAKCGCRADWATMTPDVALSLQVHPQTLGVHIVTSGAANVSAPMVSQEEACAIWAKRWGLTKGLFVEESMYNTANPGQTASLSAIGTAGRIAFHTAAGLDNSTQVIDDVDVRGGPCSLICVREFGYRGYEFVTDDPVGIKLIAAHSYCYVAPGATAAVRPSYIITGVNG